MHEGFLHPFPFLFLMNFEPEPIQRGHLVSLEVADYAP